MPGTDSSRRAGADFDDLVGVGDRLVERAGESGPCCPDSTDHRDLILPNPHEFKSDWIPIGVTGGSRRGVVDVS